MKQRWIHLARQHGLPVPDAGTTRGDWIRAAFAASNQSDTTEKRRGHSAGTSAHFEYLVHTDPWTEKWPEALGVTEAREVEGEIWNDAIQAALGEVTTETIIEARLIAAGQDAW